ncbi:SDR family oxidoreductase [Paraburkholderia acidisoli]|uniref:NAD-dependent epimerase/dehydratase family protein n=1 Tax=Paraburkholderia acidisoli TaxID=2571748 RepID=A0A7Z2JIR6_9BURK|nr:SDR family oxidoreductase [Paraburkholderia acidisoli]QGZ65438.1 NAD-dependent epimerase/dehydratase family protein [Paraburkholderia acidisoli]
MNILVCGARGFVGAALCERLERRGYRVIRGVREVRDSNECAIDYTRDVNPDDWDARLQSVDVVINAVGILIEHGRQRFETVHAKAPRALFEASVRQGVKQVIQISALGAPTRITPYFASKFAADSHLQSLPIRSCVVRPALVYGPTGTSAAFFRLLASLPVHALPAGGHQRLRPVHVDDLAEIVERLIERRDHAPRTLDVVGGEEVAYREMLAIYRRSLGFGAALRVSLPRGLIGMGAALLDRVPGSMLTRDTWRMLQADNTGDAGATASVLQRPPRGLRSFIGNDAPTLRRDALDAWQPALLRITLAFVWIWTAVASLLLYPRSASMALLRRAHLHGASAAAAFYLAIVLDLTFGLLTLLRPRRLLWLAQALLIAAYTTIIAVTMPETLWDPFGAILKNLPIFVLLLILFNQDV